MVAVLASRLPSGYGGSEVEMLIAGGSSVLPIAKRSNEVASVARGIGYGSEGSSGVGDSRRVQMRGRACRSLFFAIGPWTKRHAGRSNGTGVTRLVVAGRVPLFVALPALG